jgi:hypothetical protein
MVMKFALAWFMSLRMLVALWWKLIVLSHLHQMMLLRYTLLAIALVELLMHHWMETKMPLSCERINHLHLRHHKTSTHERIWETEWIVLTWCWRWWAALTSKMTLTLQRWWRSTRTIYCLFFKFFLFLLLLLIHNDIVCNIIDVESSVSCPWLLLYSLSIKSVDLRLKECILVCFLWSLIVHLFVALNWEWSWRKLIETSWL